MNYCEIIVTIIKTTMLIKINRDKYDNKLSNTCLNEMADAVASAGENKNIRSVIIASGKKWFCAGGDIGDVSVKSIEEIRRFGEAFISFHLAVQNSPLPIIAAVEGDAFGGGCSVIDVCDLAVISETAKLAVPEIRSGLAPAMGFSGLYHNTTKKVAMELGLMGKILSSKEAYALGLVNFVVSENEVMEKALEVAESFDTTDRLAVSLFKEMYVQMGNFDYEKRLHIGKAAMIALFKSKGDNK